jgi:hypothetical protein
MSENDNEWPVTPIHAELLARHPELTTDEQLCLAIHEVAYAIRGLAYEQSTGANLIADSVFSLGEEEDFSDEDEDAADDEPRKGRRH